MIGKRQKDFLTAQIKRSAVHSDQTLYVTASGKNYYLMRRTHDLGGTDYENLFQLTYKEAIWILKTKIFGDRYVTGWLGTLEKELEKEKETETMTVKKAPEETISHWVGKAYEALHEAERIADATGEDFSFTPAYGMGGWYTPKKLPPMTRADALALISSGADLTQDQKNKIADALDSNFYENDDWDSSTESGWNSSSSSC